MVEYTDVASWLDAQTRNKKAFAGETPQLAHNQLSGVEQLNDKSLKNFHKKATNVLKPEAGIHVYVFKKNAEFEVSHRPAPCHPPPPSPQSWKSAIDLAVALSPDIRQKYEDKGAFLVVKEWVCPPASALRLATPTPVAVLPMPNGVRRPQDVEGLQEQVSHQSATGVLFVPFRLRPQQLYDYVMERFNDYEVGCM